MLFGFYMTLVSANKNGLGSDPPPKLSSPRKDSLLKKSLLRRNNGERLKFLPNAKKS